MDVGNNTLIKYSKYTGDVKCDVYEGSMIIFNHNHLLKKLPFHGAVFTGVSLVMNDFVKCVCYNENNTVEKTSVWSDWLYVEPESLKSASVFTLVFKPLQSNNLINEFYGKFIEVKNESI